VKSSPGNKKGFDIMRKEFEDKIMNYSIGDMKDVTDAMDMALDKTDDIMSREVWSACTLGVAKKLGCKGTNRHVQVVSVKLADAFVKYLKTCEKYCDEE
jgi:hypothetical protein